MSPTFTRARETELLQAMASAGDLDTQRRLSAELESLRAQRRQTLLDAGSADWTAMLDSPVAVATAIATPTHIRTTAESDWLGDVATPTATPAEIRVAMTAQAQSWLDTVDPLVLADSVELSVQARGMAEWAGSVYGPDMALAAQTFVDAVSQRIGADMSSLDPGPQVTGDPVTTEPMSDINAPADTAPAAASEEKTTPSDTPSLDEGPVPETGTNSIDSDPPVNSDPNANDAGPTPPPKPTPTWETFSSRRRALETRLANTATCNVCQEPITRSGEGWRHDRYAQHQGYQRPHVAVPSLGTEVEASRRTADGAAVAPAAGAPAAAQPGMDPAAMGATSWTVYMTHPSGAKYSEPNVVGESPEAAIGLIRTKFPDGAAGAEWKAVPAAIPGVTGQRRQAMAQTPEEIGAQQEDPVSYQRGYNLARHGGNIEDVDHTNPYERHGWNHGSRDAQVEEFYPGDWHDPWKAASVRTADDAAGTVSGPQAGTGLNDAIDFPAATDPSSSMVLGDEDGSWPDESTGSDLTKKLPGTPTAARRPAVGLFDVRTDQYVAPARALHHHALATYGGRSIWIDGAGMPIPADIVAEPYVRGPVCQVYLGVDAPAR